ncbi:hypothetical protein JCM10003_1286 [Bacteroides pyogenes JCM 10003]|nr:hypothetical protein JCM10003_1286 [Bacteroides pyogenes JCM 10003]
MTCGAFPLLCGSALPGRNLEFLLSELLFDSGRASVSPEQSLCFVPVEPLFHSGRASVPPEQSLCSIRRDMPP